MYIIDRMFRIITGTILAVLVLAAVGMGTVNAEQSQTPTVSAFLANPGQLLQNNPNGGSLLASKVQLLALSDPSTFKVLIGLLANANEAQKGAIGQGLAHAAKIEVLANQVLAAEWQQQIAAINDPSFNTAATNAFGDVQLGAVGAGSGAAGAGIGLGGPGNGPTSGGPLEDIRPRTFPTQSFTFTSPTSGSSGSSFGSSPASSVSPTR
jgi:hypothetical protein